MGYVKYREYIPKFKIDSLSDLPIPKDLFETDTVDYNRDLMEEQTLESNRNKLREQEQKIESDDYALDALSRAERVRDELRAIYGEGPQLEEADALSRSEAAMMKEGLIKQALEIGQHRDAQEQRRLSNKMSGLTAMEKLKYDPARMAAIGAETGWEDPPLPDSFPSERSGLRGELDLIYPSGKIKALRQGKPKESAEYAIFPNPEYDPTNVDKTSKANVDRDGNTATMRVKVDSKEFMDLIDNGVPMIERSATKKTNEVARQEGLLKPETRTVQRISIPRKKPRPGPGPDSPFSR